MSTATVEQLQKIVADGNRTEQERTQAAEHILKLQGQTELDQLAAQATAGDETKPVAERIQAAREWRTALPTRNYCEQFDDASLVEKLIPHPHSERLKELKERMKDESVSVRGRFAAIDEHRRLRNEFPKRDLPQDAYVLDNWGYDDLLGREALLLQVLLQQLPPGVLGVLTGFGLEPRLDLVARAGGLDQRKPVARRPPLAL